MKLTLTPHHDDFRHSRSYFSHGKNAMYYSIRLMMDKPFFICSNIIHETLVFHSGSGHPTSYQIIGTKVASCAVFYIIFLHTAKRDFFGSHMIISLECCNQSPFFQRKWIRSTPSWTICSRLPWEGRVALHSTL